MAALTLLPSVALAQSPGPTVAGTVVEQAPAQTLPFTGSNVIPMAIGAVALVLVGTLLVITTRRRRDDTKLA
ncbi:MAG TPA: LPXTG cell wall anchor domain-containing protein [Acidimicrobiales bacterium]|nr:LPXTG cell wall anchor domain-containing protein [Acidimicrobiales bacterium]